MSAKIICVWGSPGSGKTVCSLALAAVLAEKKKNVIIYNGDKLVPSLKMMCPTVEVDSKNSIGPLLMSGRYDDTLFAQKLVMHPMSEYISFIGMAPTDTYITYGDFDRSFVIQVLNKMAQLSDYVIIDGTSNPLDDGMTLVGLELADHIVRVITPDNKGLLYQDAARSIYRDAKYKFEQHITVLGNVRSISPVSEIMSVSGKYDFVLPYAAEIENKHISGELMKDMKRFVSRQFEKQIREMVKGMEGAK